MCGNVQASVRLRFVRGREDGEHEVYQSRQETQSIDRQVLVIKIEPPICASSRAKARLFNGNKRKRVEVDRNPGLIT